MRWLPVIAASIFVFLPGLANAQGLVPIGCQNPESCGTCEFVELINNVVRFLILIASFIATLLIIYGGFKLVTSGGNVSAKQSAKSIVVNTLIGYVIILAAFLIVNTILGLLLPGGSPALGWQRIECVYPTTAESRAYTEYQAQSPQTFTGYNANTMSTAEVNAAIAAAGVQGSAYYDRICNEARAQGIGEQCNTLIALMIQESGGDPTAISPADAHGLMQILPSTARGIDPDYFADMNNEQIAAELRRNPELSIRLGVTYFNEGLAVSGGDLDNALAYYNGGPRALNDSRTCPGQTWWRCTANRGYAETRNYVANINAMRGQLSGNVLLQQ